MTPLVLLRHGESTANAGDLFAGHLDVPLTPAGALEARAAAEGLAGWVPDIVHCSPLARAADTAAIVRSRLSPTVAAEYHPALVERHYGALQGLRRADARARFGAEAVACWRRSPAGLPPGGESLQMLHERLRPYWLEELLPLLESGRSVLVVAHGNSLRMLLAHVSGLDVADAIGAEVPTAVAFRPEIRLPAR
ncbi:MULTISPECIES: 2,3-bisphosphoglycerate-dependent phosphoglycerate mutase [unclassified Amycolatopsis]|uniref:2,3-bisphosphoglycerate-dependent phosphoglycerate mutase n=1 Tax=unclassified Amycolatopsis TaxID=2618356 RepID=UPI001C6952E7|nr:2,3-bisphosphoglycerate-dependent phosphoglycerate mutase [Amycolatopsis sp. DSM 110486]QYN21426.1 2,3-bisphosphoglycerate-dependent phosphoglycerate mutase [Amycolatopsis sp. DSM 110486]